MKVKIRFGLTIAAVLLLIIAPLSFSSPKKAEQKKETVKNNNEKETQAVDKQSLPIELVERDVLQLSEVNDRDKTLFGCDFTEKVVSLISPGVTIHKNKDDKSDIVGYMLPMYEATIISIEKDWTYVSFKDTYGYVKNETVLFGREALSVAGEHGTKIHLPVKDYVPVYFVCDSTTEAKCFLKKNQEVTCIRACGDYVLISHNNETGYVLASDIKESYRLTQAMNKAEYDAYMEDLRIQEEIKRKKEEEERRRKEREAAIQAGLDKYIPTVQGQATTLTTDDLWLLACIIKYESGWEPYEGKLAVANVVLNRYKQGAGSIAQVIYARNQFSGVSDGNGGPSEYFKEHYRDAELSHRLPQHHADECMKAAVEATAGINNIGDFRFFMGVGIADFNEFADYKIIGGHVFYSRR